LNGIGRQRASAVGGADRLGIGLDARGEILVQRPELEPEELAAS
jgi:hypothetical protein